MGLDSGSNVSGTCVETVIAALGRGLNWLWSAVLTFRPAKLIDYLADSLTRTS